MSIILAFVSHSFCYKTQMKMTRATFTYTLQRNANFNSSIGFFLILCALPQIFISFEKNTLRSNG